MLIRTATNRLHRVTYTHTFICVPYPSDIRTIWSLETQKLIHFEATSFRVFMLQQERGMRFRHHISFVLCPWQPFPYVRCINCVQEMFKSVNYLKKQPDAIKTRLRSQRLSTPHPLRLLYIHLYYTFHDVKPSIFVHKATLPYATLETYVLLCELH